MRVRKFLCFAGLSALLLNACSRKPEKAAPAPPAAAARPDWPTFAAAFIEQRFKADPSFAVQSGRHEFDGQMPDWSRAGIEADIAQLRATLDELHRFDPAALPPAQRFERAYLEWVIDTQMYWEASAEFPFRNPAWYIDKLDPSMYLTRDYAPLAVYLRRPEPTDAHQWHKVFRAPVHFGCAEDRLEFALADFDGWRE